MLILIEQGTEKFRRGKAIDSGVRLVDGLSCETPCTKLLLARQLRSRSTVTNEWDARRPGCCQAPQLRPNRVRGREKKVRARRGGTSPRPVRFSVEIVEAVESGRDAAPETEDAAIEGAAEQGDVAPVIPPDSRMVLRGWAARVIRAIFLQRASRCTIPPGRTFPCVVWRHTNWRHAPERNVRDKANEIRRMTARFRIPLRGVSTSSAAIVFHAADEFSIYAKVNSC